MKTLLNAGLAALLLVPAALAQAPTRSVGVGVSLDMTASDGFTLGSPGGPSFEARMGNLHLPIAVGPKFRIEPMFGYARDHQEASTATQTTEETASVLRLGVGFLYVMPRGQHFQVYAGPRLGIWRLRAEQRNSGPGFPPFTQTFRQTNKFIAGVFGGEYFVSPAFSIGGEAQLNYTFYGEIDVSVDPSPGPVPDSDNSGSKIETAGLIVLRWFP